ncbi:MAG: type II secretion system protein, partial [Mycobacteriales bacterium]
MLDRLRARAQRSDEGFTLIELLIVIVILGILAAIVVFAVGNSTSDAKSSACKADIKTVETADEAFKATTGAYATAMTDLTGASVSGPFLKEVPTSATFVFSSTGVAGTCGA